MPLDYLNLYNLSPTDLASAFSQLQGEAGTGIAQAGTQAMNSFLSLVTNPFNNNRPFALNRLPSEIGPRMPLKALGYASESPPSSPSLAFDSVDSIAFGGGRRLSVWGGGYGGQNITTGDASAGTHDRTARVYGVAAGLDYLVTPTRWSASHSAAAALISVWRADTAVATATCSRPPSTARRGLVLPLKSGPT